MIIHIYAFLLVNMTNHSYTEDYAREIRTKVAEIYQARITADLFHARFPYQRSHSLTTYREGDHLVPVLPRTLREKRQDLNDLSVIFVNGSHGKVPLSSIAEVIPTWKPAVIARQNHIPTVTVGARVEEGMLANAELNMLSNNDGIITD